MWGRKRTSRKKVAFGNPTQRSDPFCLLYNRCTERHAGTTDTIKNYQAPRHGLVVARHVYIIPYGSSMREMVGGCCVCSDERGWAENPLVYCDGHGCSVAVHQGNWPCCITMLLPIWRERLLRAYVRRVYTLHRHTYIRGRAASLSTSRHSRGRWCATGYEKEAVSCSLIIVGRIHNAR